MGFVFSSDHLGRSKLVLTAEPDYIVPLQIAPPSLEDCLKRGRWLVVSMSVWSVHDVRAGHHAIEMVKPYGGSIMVGLRPFDYPQENAAWIPGLKDKQLADQVEILVADEDHKRHVAIQGKPDASPVWVAIVDGRVMDVRRGLLADHEIEALIIQLLSAPGPATRG